jgi:hypothetical protein
LTRDYVVLKKNFFSVYAVEETPHKEEIELIITLPRVPILKDGLH